MQSPPQVIVFDLGKVLLDFDYSLAARKIVECGRISFEDLTGWLTKAPLLYQYETGLMTSHEFYEEMCARTGYSRSVEDFGECFADIFTPIQPMIDLQAELRRQGWPTFIFSNTNEFAVRYIRRAFPFFSNFDGYILSYEHRAMKPDHRLYEVVERVTGRRGLEILYLDDRPENVEAGLARGWQAIVQESPEKTRAFLERIAVSNRKEL